MVLIPTGHYPREATKAGTPLRDMARRQCNQGKEPSDVYLDLFYMPYLRGLFTTKIHKIIVNQEDTRLNNYKEQKKKCSI